MRVALIALATVAACGNGNTAPYSPGEQAGTACATADTCYPDVQDKTQIAGEVQCLTKVSGGYCTHLCTADTDCCAVPGECRTGHPQVCAPFENQTATYCFLSCEDADLKAAGYTDSTLYCHDFASATFNCRSTGGGTNNRKICSSG